MSASAKKLPQQPQPWLEAVERGLTRYPSRAAWLKARAAGIGGSEAAIIMGASAWGSPYQLWQDKTGLAPTDDFDSELLRFGRVVEPLVAADYENLTGRQLLHLGDWAIRKHPDIDCMFATHDRIILPGAGTPPPNGRTGPGILSIKSANVWKGVEWTEGEEPPLPYQVQFQHELACSGFTWGSFAVLIWGKGVKWIDAERNDRFIGTLEAECKHFWQRVLKGEPPETDGSEHTFEALRRRFPRGGGAPIDLPPEAEEWAERVDVINAQMRKLEAEKDGIQNKVRALLGDADVGILPSGAGWSYKLEGAKPASVIPAQPEQRLPAYPGKRVLRRIGKKKGK